MRFIEKNQFPPDLSCRWSPRLSCNGADGHDDQRLDTIHEGGVRRLVSADRVGHCPTPLASRSSSAWATPGPGSGPDATLQAGDGAWHVGDPHCTVSLVPATLARPNQNRPRRSTLMDTVIPGLYASEPEPLGFGPSLGIRAFLLQRNWGNLLIYRSEARRWSETWRRSTTSAASHASISTTTKPHPPATGSPKRSTLRFTFMRKMQGRSLRSVTWTRRSPNATSSMKTSRSSPFRGTRAGQRLSSGIRGSIASCSPATRSSLVGANGGLRYSTGSATGSDTSRAWS